MNQMQADVAYTPVRPQGGFLIRDEGAPTPAEYGARKARKRQALIHYLVSIGFDRGTARAYCRKDERAMSRVMREIVNGTAHARWCRMNRVAAARYRAMWRDINEMRSRTLDEVVIPLGTAAMKSLAEEQDRKILAAYRSA